MSHSEAASIFIPTNGILLHAKTSGPDSGPLVILLHGFPEFWYGWCDYLEILSNAGYHVIIPDQRGYNLSEKPGLISAYQIGYLAQDVIGILDFFGKEKAVVAGNDWGAAVAWYLGMHSPERVERLVIVNVPHFAAFNKALQKPILKQLIKSWYIAFFQLPHLPEWVLSRNNFTALKKALSRTSRPGTFSNQDLDQYTSAWNKPGALTGMVNWYRAMTRLGWKQGREKTTSQFQHRITMPTLVIWGDRDAFLEPVLADLSMEWVNQGTLIRFKDASHWVHLEEKEKVGLAILEFLQTKG